MGTGYWERKVDIKKFHANYLSKYFIVKIYNEISGKGQLFFKPTAFLNKFFKNVQQNRIFVLTTFACI